MMQAKKSKTELSAKEVLDIFEQKGALLTGHFQLTSGLHSEQYLQCALVLQYPQLAEQLGEAIASKFSRSKMDCVVGPAVGGIIVAQEVGRSLGARAMFSEREAGTMKLRRGFSIKQGERVLVVEDVTTTGGSIREVVAFLEQAKAVVVGIGAIIDRSGGSITFDYPFRPLAHLEVSTFTAEACPLCQKGIPLSKPGSRKL